MKYTDYVDTNLGWLAIRATDAGITAIEFVEEPDSRPSSNTHTAAGKLQLEEYFAGLRTEFELTLAPIGTAFQKSVWHELCKVPYGKTESYQYIADQLNNTKAVRAVGAANGKNPIAIVVPCHRIIGKNGSLTGYAGGLSRKAALLELENNVTQ